MFKETQKPPKKEKKWNINKVSLKLTK
jgi:hypothetical protein